jgi:hypothetical protein
MAGTVDANLRPAAFAIRPVSRLPVLNRTTENGPVSQIERARGRIDRMHAAFEYLFDKPRASVRAAVRLWLLRAMFSRGVRLYRCGMEPQWSTSGPKDRRIDITGRNPTLAFARLRRRASRAAFFRKLNKRRVGVLASVRTSSFASRESFLREKRHAYLGRLLGW